MLGCFSEHIPRSTRLALVVANIFVRQTDTEHSVCVANGWGISTARHNNSVNLLRYEFKASFVVNVLELKFLFARKHSSLKADYRGFALDNVVIEVQIFGYALVDEVVEVLCFVHHLNAGNGSLTLRAYLGAVQTVLLDCT